jgi:hypothetical protein
MCMFRILLPAWQGLQQGWQYSSTRLRTQLLQYQAKMDSQTLGLHYGVSSQRDPAHALQRFMYSSGNVACCVAA